MKQLKPRNRLIAALAVARSQHQARLVASLRVRTRCASYSSRFTCWTLVLTTVCQLWVTPLAAASWPKTGRDHSALAKRGKRTSDPRKAAGLRLTTISAQLTPEEQAIEAARVRHAPTINAGRVEGSIRQLTGETVTLNAGAVITSALLVPGTPSVTINGNPNFGGTVEGTGSTQPSGYDVILNGNSTLGRLVTRVDPIPLPTVDPPPQPTGSRDVVINQSGQSPGDFATIRDLTLNGNVGNVAVPPGTYRNFVANGGAGFIFGISSGTEPAVYNLARLTLNANAVLDVVGPVVLTLGNNLTLNGPAGASTDPRLLTLKVASGGATLNGGASLYAALQAPSGSVIINGNSLLQGSVACDRLTVNGGGLLKGTPGVLSSISPASGTQGQSLTVTLRGRNTHWVAGLTRATFGGEVSVGGAPAGEFGPIQVTDPSTAAADLVLSQTAALAPRSVHVMTPVTSFDEGEVEMLIDGFRVNAASPPGPASSQVFTVAGLTGEPGFADGPASQARFHSLSGIAAGPDDAIYAADAGNNRIRTVTPGSAGVPPAVSTLAGDGVAGFADGPAAIARFNNPQGVAVDPFGVVYVADTDNHRIRRIATDGTVSTLAGDGTPGFQDGAGNQARFNSPSGVAIDNAGNLYVADVGNSAVRIINPNGNVSTVAGDGTIGSSDSPNARFNGLTGIVVDGMTAYIYLADTGNHRIRRLDPQGAVITIAGADRGFVDGSAAQSRFADPSGIAVDGTGHLIVADSTNSLVREVDPDAAFGGAPGSPGVSSADISPTADSFAVTTLAGTGDRGLTDGAGNLARFFTPRGVAVSASSAIIVADTGNHVLRRILLPPRITGFVPSSGGPGDTVMIDGARFDGRSPDRNIVRFTRSAQAGGGTTQAQVTMAARTQLAVIVPADATTGPVTVQTEGGAATSPSSFVVTSGPVITDFNPKSAPAGTLVNVIGTNLAPPAGTAAEVTLNKQGGGTIAAPVSNATATNLSFVIPTGAATGPVTVTVGGQSATSLAALTIIASSDFALIAVPAVADLIQGQSIAYAVSLSSTSGFSQLADLNVAGLPSGVTASFKPSRITAGQTSVLTLKAPASQPTGSAPLTVSASSNVDGIALNKSANVTLNIRPITTSFMGRTVVADTLQTPLAGVRITLLGRDGNGNPTGCSGQTFSDAAGNFAFTNLPSSCTGSQLIRYDGTTAVSPPGEYAGVDLVYNIVPNQVTSSPVLVHLPRIDDKETVLVRQNSPTDQTFTFRTIPGLSATVYAGTTLTLVDGTRPDPFPFTAVQVPVDRLPDAKPPNPAMLMVFIVAFQPANAEASQPVAITYPNTINTPPGTNMVLMTLDPTKGQMVPYGTGTVSSDGRQVIPDLDPAHPGKRFGLVHFDWHGQMPPPKNDLNPCPALPCPCEGDPVDISSGLIVINETDVAIGGLRGGASIVRTYRTLKIPGGPLVGGGGPFGHGSSHNYSFELDTPFPESAQTLNLVMPDGNQFPFARQADGTFINSTIPSLLGAVIRVVSPGVANLRWKDGTTFHFVRKGSLILREVLESIVDSNGNKTTLVLDADGVRITDVIDSVGRRLQLAYNEANNITEIRDPVGRRVRYGYNPAQRSVGNLLTSVIDPEGGVTLYNYDSRDRLASITNARGIVVALNTFDQNGRVIEQRRADRGTLRFAYKLLNPLVGTSPVIETTVTDPLGRQTVYRFNPQAFLIDVTDATGQTRVLERDSSNQVVAIKGPASCAVCGVSSEGDQSFSHDSNGNLLSVTDALGNTTKFTYDPAFNRITSVTDPAGSVARFAYDSSGNILSSTDANGNSTTFAYNAVSSFGLIKSVTDPLGNATNFSYDGFGNLSTITDPLGNATVIGYDAVSRPIATVKALGHRSAISYDNLDRIVSITDAKGGVTRFGYDPVGNLLSVTDAKGNTTSFTYDAVGLLRIRTTPLGRTDTRMYDVNGNLTSFVDRRGQTSQFEYDELSRLVRETYQDSSVIRSYDATGHLARVTDSMSGDFSFSYDLAGRLIESVGPLGAVRYDYDRLGRVLQRLVVGQQPVDYMYDRAGNLIRAATTGAAVDYSYDARNQTTTLGRSNGVTSRFIYDELGRLIELNHSKGTATLISQAYSYDAVGNRVSYTTTSGQPMITQPATSEYDAGNRLLRRGATTFSYDDNGNLISAGGPQGATNYTWDPRNHLRSITTAAGQTMSFVYDFAGNLLQQKDTGTLRNLTQSFVLDDLTNVAYLSNSNGEQFSILTGQSIDEHLAVIQSGTHVEYGLTDAINSTTTTVDQKGSIKGQFFYEPFGETTPMASSYPFQFTGRVPVSGGLYYYRARYFNSISGRFISEDPIGLAGGINQYAYVDGNPVTFRDPRGLLPIGLLWLYIPPALEVIDFTIGFFGPPSGIPALGTGAGQRAGTACRFLANDALDRYQEFRRQKGLEKRIRIAFALHQIERARAARSDLLRSDPSIKVTPEDLYFYDQIISIFERQLTKEGVSVPRR